MVEEVRVKRVERMVRGDKCVEDGEEGKGCGGSKGGEWAEWPGLPEKIKKRENEYISLGLGGLGFLEYSHKKRVTFYIHLPTKYFSVLKLNPFVFSK